MKILFKLIDLILNIFNKRYLNKLTKQCKTEFKGYHLEDDKEDQFKFNYSSIFYKYNIHKFYCSYINSKIMLCIELESPGIFIGRKGKNIEAIEKHLNIKIHLIESKLWK